MLFADSNQGREHSYELVAQAVNQAAADILSQPTNIKIKTPPKVKVGNSQNQLEPPAPSGLHQTAFLSADAQFKAAMLEKYGSLAAAFASFSKDGGVNVKKLKKATKKLLPSLPHEHAKKLRKKLNQVDSLSAFTALFGGTEDNPTKQTVTTTSMELAVLPADVPDRE